MEATEVCSFTIPELVTSSFCAEWSEDNQFTIITDKGVHVFELQPNPLCPNPTPKFKRSFLYPTDYFPTEIFSSTIDNQIINYDRENLYSLIMESSLTPKLDDKTEHIPRIISAVWSPIKLVKPSNCLLATLTSAGAVDLLYKSGKNWYSLRNISLLWWNIIKSEVEFNPEENIDSDINIDPDTFRKTAEKVVTTAITWSPLQNNTKNLSCYFATAFKTGDFSVWNINQISELSLDINPTISYRIQLETENVRIMKLCWITCKENKHLIIIGYFNGQIHGLMLDNMNGKLEKSYLKKYEENSDHMPVSCIQSKIKENEEIIVLITKSYFLNLLLLDKNGILLQKLHVQVLGFSITGMVMINDNETIVTTQDGAMHIVTHTQSTLKSEKIFYDNRSTKVQYLGLMCSISKAILINVASPNCSYDHLINREPSVMQILHLNGDQWDPWSILNSSKNNLNIYWDCLETIRIKAAKTSEPDDILPKIPDELETLSIHRLQIVMWLTLITQVLQKKKSIKKIDNVFGEISEAQPLIFVHNASNHLIKLAKKKIHTDNNRLSIHFLRLYLEVFLAGEDEGSNHNTINCAKKAIEETSNIQLIESEPCNLCGEIITELPWNISSCPNGHKLPRCALTLLQITCLKYRNCPVCGRIFHPSLDDEYEQVKCLYCEIPAIYDNRIVGVNDEIEEKCKNLSLRPIWEIQLLLKNQEFESSVGKSLTGTEKRSIKKQKIDDTFKIVVEKKDESIVETWQEL